MPIKKVKGGWKWGSKGPFTTKKKAKEVQRAAYASGYTGKMLINHLTDYINKHMEPGMKRHEHPGKQYSASAAQAGFEIPQLVFRQGQLYDDSIDQYVTPHPDVLVDLYNFYRERSNNAKDFGSRAIADQNVHTVYREMQHRGIVKSLPSTVIAKIDKILDSV